MSPRVKKSSDLTNVCGMRRGKHNQGFVTFSFTEKLGLTLFFRFAFDVASLISIFSHFYNNIKTTTVPTIIHTSIALTQNI